MTVDGDSKGKAKQETHEPRGDHISHKRNAIALAKEKIEGMGAKEKGDFGAEDNASCGQDCEGAFITIRSSLRGWQEIPKGKGS